MASKRSLALSRNDQTSATKFQYKSVVGGNRERR